MAGKWHMHKIGKWHSAGV